MPAFLYRAVNEDGDELTGSIESAGKDEALQALKDLHLTVKELTEAVRSAPVAPISLSTAPKKPGEVFLETVATENIPPPPPPAEPEKKKKASLNVKQYLPLIDTLRLYAGNLFAWYAIVMALGYYVHVRALPFSIPFVGGLFISSIVFSFLVATFLFLMLTSILRALKGGVLMGSVLAVLGIGLFFVTKTFF